eukprot:COSAG04_NODE_7482_length_1120_cov_1.228208_3_plen_28_part_01
MSDLRFGLNSTNVEKGDFFKKESSAGCR